MLGVCSWFVFKMFVFDMVFNGYEVISDLFVECVQIYFIYIEQSGVGCLGIMRRFLEVFFLLLLIIVI